MRKPALSAAALVIALGALTACGTDSTPTADEPKNPTAATSGAPAKTEAKELTADGAFKELSAKVTTAKLSGTVTADNDPNHLLGRPNQYTSKITFTDSRIKADDIAGSEKGSVEQGGSIEVFANEADAKARADYIKAITKSAPMFAEYDYLSGTVLIRVSHYLTPAQAADYKTAAANLG